MAVEVTVSTGVSCISRVSRDEDNGSDSEDNLDNGQQGRTSPRLSVPRGNSVIQMGMHVRLLLSANGHSDRPANVRFRGQSRHHTDMR